MVLVGVIGAVHEHEVGAGRRRAATASFVGTGIGVREVAVAAIEDPHIETSAGSS